MAHLPGFSGLTAFYAAVRNGTLTGAAAALNVSQPAVSRRIAALEAELGCRLFDRNHKPARLTDEGRQLMRALRSGFGQIEQAVEALRRAGRARPVTIAGPSGFIAYWLIPKLAELEAAFPSVPVRIMSQEHGEPGTSADLDVRFGLPDPDRPGEVQILGEEVYPVASPLYLARRGLDPARPVFVGQTLLTMQSARRHWYDWPAWFEATGAHMPEDTRHLDFNTYAMVVNAALAGQGIALSWAGLLEAFVETGALVRLDGPVAKSQRGYFMAARDGFAARREVRAVADWLVRKT
ncbi:MAG: LysR family transcriptional regulator [Paracoccaceae bacterium]